MISVRRLLLFIALFSWQPTATVALGQDTKSTIRVYTPGPSILSLTFKIAKEEDFCKQEGVNLQLITMASEAGVQALVAGSVDASQILGLTLRAAINRGAPLKIVMVFNDRPTYRLMAKKRSRPLAISEARLSPAVPLALPQMLCYSGSWKSLA